MAAINTQQNVPDQAMGRSSLTGPGEWQRAAGILLVLPYLSADSSAHSAPAARVARAHWRSAVLGRRFRAARRIPLATAHVRAKVLPPMPPHRIARPRAIGRPAVSSILLFDILKPAIAPTARRTRIRVSVLLALTP